MNVDWAKVRKEFEEVMAVKLKRLPDHRKVPKNLQEFRSIISHELPETAPKKVYQELIEMLLSGKSVNLKEAKDKYLKPHLKAEEEILSEFREELARLRGSARKWVKKNLSEAELKHLWNGHKTWLPRRHGLYKRQVSFQRIAADTLARYALINKLFSISSAMF